MKKTVISFILRMGIVFFVLCAMYSLEAYTAGKMCAEMLILPACTALAWASYKAEQNLYRSKPAKAVVRVAVKKHNPMRVA